MKTCQACSRELDDEMRFCDRCGQPQRMAPMRTQPTFERPQPVRVLGAPKLIVPLALLMVGLIIGIAIGGALLSRIQIQTVTQQITTTSTLTVQPQDLLERCFSPGGNCASRIVYWIGHANTSIHIMIYSFTLNMIGDAILNAKQRNPNMDIKIVWDESNVNGTGSEYQRLKAAGIDIRVDHRHGLLHDKVAIIDSHIIITGSFNWSQAANEENRENLLVIDNQAWAAAYEQQFQIIHDASSTIISTTTSQTTSGVTQRVNCDPAYPTVCIPPPPPDLDCKDITDRNFTVLPPDPHGFDGDGDGTGCET